MDPRESFRALLMRMASSAVISGRWIACGAADAGRDSAPAGCNLLLYDCGCSGVAGAGWTLSASELWIAAQRAMPDWVRGR